MKTDADCLIRLPTSATKPPSAAGADSPLSGKGRYKFWALAAILLLALWSMLTGTVTLNWSAGDLGRLSDALSSPIHDDLDILEVEEREKVVRHMWDVYAHGRRLPRFWQQSFEAAYQELDGDDPEARAAAIAEIAKMSMRMLDLETPTATTRHLKKTEGVQRKGGDRAKAKSSTSSSKGPQ